jgi:two-component system, LuxR family, sensor kinase FixL
MGQARKITWLAHENRTRSLAVAASLVVVFALAEWFFGPHLGLGFGYLLPLVLASAFLGRLQVVSFALVCTALSQLFIPAEPEKWVRIALTLSSYIFVSLVVRGLVLYRRAATDHLHRLQGEMKKLQEAQEQLAWVIQSSPVAIITVYQSGEVVFSNSVAHELFNVAPGALTGQLIATFLPDLPRLSGLDETGSLVVIESRAVKAGGDHFVAHVSLSILKGTAGPLVAVAVLNADVVTALSTADRSDARG